MTYILCIGWGNGPHIDLRVDIAVQHRSLKRMFFLHRTVLAFSLIPFDRVLWWTEVFMPVSHCFGYLALQRALKLDCLAHPISFFLKIISNIWGALKFLTSSRMDFFLFLQKKQLSDFDRECIKYVESWGSPNPWTWVSSQRRVSNFLSFRNIWHFSMYMVSALLIKFISMYSRLSDSIVNGTGVFFLISFWNCPFLLQKRKWCWVLILFPATVPYLLALTLFFVNGCHRIFIRLCCLFKKRAFSFSLIWIQLISSSCINVLVTSSSTVSNKWGKQHRCLVRGLSKIFGVSPWRIVLAVGFHVWPLL